LNQAIFHRPTFNYYLKKENKMKKYNKKFTLKSGILVKI